MQNTLNAATRKTFSTPHVLMHPGSDIRPGGAANVHQRVVDRVADGANIFFEARAVVPTTQGFTSAMPSAGSISTKRHQHAQRQALRTGASHGAPIDPNRK